jgi:REP element-mobilizing transposase RayT
MGRSRYRICHEKAPHFLTCTVLNWIPLFTRPQTAGIILDALRYRQEETGWKIYGYVILENHIHMIVQAENLVMELPLQILHSSQTDRPPERMSRRAIVATTGVFSQGLQT